MNRRRVLQLVTGAAASFAVAKDGFADESCAQAVQTPYGSVQRCTVGIRSINLQQSYQQMPEWCWAACISMVFGYYGHPVSQQRIVKETWGVIANVPGQPSDILRDLNRNWTDDRGAGFSSRADYLTANGFNAVEDLKQDRPLIIGSMGHATVLTAMTGDTNMQTGAWQIVEAIVRDPWPGNGGRRALTPAEWMRISFAARVWIG